MWAEGASDLKKLIWTRTSWLNCALRDYEAVYWVSIGHYEAVAVGNWWYWVSRGHSCLYILQKVEIWTGVTDAWQTTLKDRATQLLIKYKSGALVTQKYEKAPSGIHGGWIIDHKKNSLENPNPMQPNMITRNLQKSIHIFNRNDIILKKNSKKIENNF